MTVNVIVHGTGDPVVMHPCLGRGAADFDQVAEALAAAGFKAVAINPRGIEGSPGSLEGPSVRDLAGDMADVIRDLGVEKAHVVGHAFGYRVAAAVELYHPELVRSLSFLACGWKYRATPEVSAALDRCYMLDLPWEERAQDIKTAFFAPKNDPAVWREGWYPEAAAAQSGSMLPGSFEEWKENTRAPLLIVQGLDDTIAPPGNGHDMKADLGDRVTVMDLPDAGHALLPEQPAGIAEALITFLRQH